MDHVPPHVPCTAWLFPFCPDAVDTQRERG
jgi:hypothetical protein